MPEIGEIRRAKELGRKGSNRYIWHACNKCGKERWVRLLKGASRSVRCSKHKNGFAEDNSNWRLSSTVKNGRQRAIRWYPLQPCEICGNKAERHHRDGDTLNNEQSNIAFLCRKHHMRIDGRLEQFIKMRGERSLAIIHCPQGHPYDKENTYKYPDGRRACRICIKVYHRRRYETAN